MHTVTAARRILTALGTVVMLVATTTVAMTAPAVAEPPVNTCVLQEEVVFEPAVTNTSHQVTVTVTSVYTLCSDSVNGVGMRTFSLPGITCIGLLAALAAPLPASSETISWTDAVPATSDIQYGGTVTVGEVTTSTGSVSNGRYQGYSAARATTIDGGRLEPLYCWLGLQDSVTLLTGHGLLALVS